MLRRQRDLKKLTIAMLDLSVIAKKKGILGLSQYENQIRKEPYLETAIQMAVDGYNAKHIDSVLSQDIEAQIERHKRSASITKKASEVAPTMGLIGTLLGLVQMLADLENPESIGPAMAIALLTTLYGAILGTIVMAPLTAKLEKNSADEALFQTLVLHTATAIAKQDNPRNLEMLLNAELPPSERVRYFD
jgi:chemotaxis protein MotA